jgi:MFS family permease
MNGSEGRWSMARETASRPGVRTLLGALPRNVWAVTLTSFLTDVSSEMLFPLLPLFLSNVLGAKTGVVGLVEGVAETTASLLKVISGRLSDRLGRRKGLAVAGYALSTLAKPWLLLARGWGSVLGVRFVERSGKGVRTAPRDALLADSIDPAQRGLAFGLHRAGDTAGAVVGLCLALGVVSVLERDALTLTRPVFQTLVLISIVPSVLGVLVLALLAREVPGRSRAADDPPPAGVGLDRRFATFLLIMVVFTLGNSSDAFLVLRAQAAGLSVRGVLGMLITFNLVYTFVSVPAGLLSDRFGRRRVMVSGWVVYAAIYLGFARVSAGWQAWALMTAYGAYYAMTEGVAKAFVADLVPAERRGHAYGLFNAATGLAALPASLIAGALWQGVGGWPGLGPGAPFYFGAALALAASALLALALPEKRHI